MLKFGFALFFCSVSLVILAQFKITIHVYVPKTDTIEDYYLAGNNNKWNPADQEQLFSHVSEQEYLLILNNVPASFEFKITKGNWGSVECKMDGTNIANRKFYFTKDTTINIVIDNFQSDKNLIKKKSTASPQVKIISDSFFMRKLNRYRRIWIYLPKNYNGTKRFPVLYMHDGQNLFDEATAYSKEWGIDEYLDKTKKNCIVVGIDNGGEKRMAEYNYFKNQIEATPEGHVYAHVIVNELRDYINKHYKTKKDKSNTFIAGSSMGGLISFLIGLNYPKVFGKIGVFSPSFWINYETVKYTVKKTKKIKNQDFYFYYGMEESKNLEKEVTTIYDLTKQKRTKSSVVLSSWSLGKHNEESWNEQLHFFFNWLLDK